MTRPVEWLAGNRVIPLDADTPSSILRSGSVAVFAVDRETGERLHLFSVFAGELLLALVCPAAARNPGANGGPFPWDIAAVPVELSCIEQVQHGPVASIVSEASASEASRHQFALETWLGKIAGAVGRFRPAGDAQPTLSNRPMNLKNGERVVSSGLDCVRLESGSGLLSGTPVPSGATVALLPGLWLQAVGEAVCRPAEPANSAVLTATTDLALAALFEVLAEVKRGREATERERFLARQELNRRISQGALGALARIVGMDGRDNETGAQPSGASGGPLFEAFRVAAAAMGVTIRPIRSSGHRTAAVREIAQNSGVRTRTVVLEGEWWRQEHGPLVGQWNEGTPVALLPCRKGYEILDPTAGTRQPVTRANAAELNTFAQMLYRPLPADLSASSLLRHALRSKSRDIRTMVLAGMAAAALGMAAPQGFAVLVSQAIPDADVNMILQVGAGMIAAAFGSAVFLFTQAVALLRVQSAAFMALQTGVWDYLLKLGPAFFRGFTAGQLRVRADAITRIHQVLTADAMRSLFAGAASFVIIALMLWYSPALALIALFFGVIVIIQTWLGTRALFQVQKQWQEMEESLSGLMLQSIHGVSKLRVAGAGNRAFSYWALEYSRKQKLSLKVQSLKDRMRLINMITPGLAAAVALLYLLSQPVPLGAFLACNAAMTAFLAALTSASDSFSGLLIAANLWERVNTVFRGKPEVDSSKVHPGRLRGAVAMENVTFRYRADGPMILDNVSIRAEPGECIALTGPSGSGKSTLLNLMLRFETPWSGAIHLDGRELSSLNINAVRRQIGVVTQDGRIMSGTLFENICCGGVNTMDETWEAARAAGLADDIKAMPMGMHTVISEGGGNLSGGQRQRVLIARALVLKPAILIFDEATSALDNRTQAIVTESLSRLKATRILVAHRLSTIRNADRIYVIDRGKVVQEGSYEELLNAPGLFTRLASRQTA